MLYYPVVVQSIAGDEKNIIVYFSDGRITQFDMMPLIKQGGVFKRLENDEFFVKHLTVMNDTVAWDPTGRHDPTDCLDIDPETLYNARIVKDPLEAEKTAANSNSF